MSDSKLELANPVLLAVWPGMGHVALSAGYYLLAKLTMNGFAEFAAVELFDVEHVLVKRGRIQPIRLPRSRLFVWKDPARQQDLVLFLGEAQPPLGRYSFCRKLVETAQELGVQRIVTFAAMATDMRPEHASRVFGAATDANGVAEVERLGVELLQDGQIGGLNGVLLGVAAEVGISGLCLLGEIPHIFAQVPFPKASLAVLEIFTRSVRIEIDYAELADQARTTDRKLGEVLAQVEARLRSNEEEPNDPESFLPEPEEPRLGRADLQRLEGLFAKTREDRSKAYELKQELDRLGVFAEYEDRFLDLFKKAD